MKKFILAVLIPPLAITRYGINASWTAAPIAVFWLASIVGITVGLQSGPLNPGGPTWLIVGLGIVMWIVAAMWAELVITGVEHDLHHDPESTLDHKIEPTPDEPDPFKELSKGER